MSRPVWSDTVTVYRGEEPDAVKLGALSPVAQYNIESFGVRGDQTDTDPALIANAVETVLADAPSGYGVELYFPPGNYRLTGPVVVERDGYSFHRLRIRGAGASQTLIRQRYPTDDIFVFANTGAHYSAELAFDGICFYWGAASIRVDNFRYSQITGCAFRGTGHGAHSIVLQGTTGDVSIENVWTYHAQDFLRVHNGSVVLRDSLIGEDAGSVHVSGSLLASNVVWKMDNRDKGNPSGHLGMGPAAVTVEGESRATFVGCSISTQTGTAFCNADKPAAVSFVGNTYSLHGGPLVRSRRLWGGRGVSIQGGHARVSGSGDLWETVPGHTISNSEISGLRIVQDAGKTLSVPNDFFDPARGNVYGNNIVRAP